MVAATGVRAEQRADSEAAIVDAAWRLFARSGPDGTSMRDVAAAAGCSHSLVTRYFGSKAGLVDTVARRLVTATDAAMDAMTTASVDPVPARLAELLGHARTHRRGVQLLIRMALGDVRADGFPQCLHADRLLATAPAPDGRATSAERRRARLRAYAAASLLVGFVTFEDFLVTAVGLGRLAPGRRDRAMGAVGAHLLAGAGPTVPSLRPRDLSAPRSMVVRGPARSAAARDALLHSAVDLFAMRGPASVSLREVAAAAGANLGLVHRHFGNKDDLLAAAIEEGSSGLFPAALAVDGFEFDAMSWLVHHESPAPRLIARTLVDEVPITSVRQRFPVLRQMLAGFGDVPRGAGPGAFTDPRVAVAAAAALAMGSSMWGPHLRGALGLGEDDGHEAAVADLARWLMSAPFEPMAPAEVA